MITVISITSIAQTGCAIKITIQVQRKLSELVNLVLNYAQQQSN